MTNKRNALTENPINTTPDNSTTRANMNHTTASSEYTPNNDDDNINSPISSSPNPSPSDDDIDENFIANFDPNAPLTLETQYQQDLRNWHNLRQAIAEARWPSKLIRS